MRNPFLSKREYIVMYLLAWTLLAGVHASLLYLHYHFPIAIVLTDALVSNIILALFALNSWFTVRYVSFETQKVYTFLLNHALIAALYLSLSAFLIYQIISFFPFGPAYTSFLRVTAAWRISIGIFYYLAVVLIYYLHIYYQSFKTRLMNEAELYRSVKETELLLLKSQLHPHFIFNSLNSINALILINPEQAQEMLVKLSQVFRRSLEQSDRKLVSLGEELEYALLYLDIEKIRFGDRLHIQVKVEEELKALPVPHMLLQPLFENCIKHGLQNSTEGIHIQIEAKREEDYLHLLISNEYDESLTENNRKGTGLNNIRKRLALLYGRKDLIKIQKENGQYAIEIIILVHSV